MNCIKGIDTSHKRVQRYYILYGLLVSFFKCNEGSKLISVLLTSSGLFTFLFYGFVAVYVVDVIYVMNKANVALLILYNRGSSRKSSDSKVFALRSFLHHVKQTTHFIATLENGKGTYEMKK